MNDCNELELSGIKWNESNDDNKKEMTIGNVRGGNDSAPKLGGQFEYFI